MKKTEAGFWSIFVLASLSAIIGRSVTLEAEAVHSLIDAITVSISAYAMKLISCKDSKYTYGFHRLEVFTSLLNVAVVAIGSITGLILAIFFLLNDVKDNPLILLLSSLISFLIALFIVSESDEKDKSSGVTLHAIQDGIIYLVGAISGVVILFTRMYFVDPLTAFLEIPLVIATSFKALKNSFYIFMERSPVDVNEIRAQLNAVFPNIDDIHVWDLCEHVRIATLHVRERSDISLRELDKKREIAEEILKDKFNITHVTIQFESSESHTHEI